MKIDVIRAVVTLDNGSEPCNQCGSRVIAVDTEKEIVFSCYGCGTPWNGWKDPLKAWAEEPQKNFRCVAEFTNGKAEGEPE